MDQWVILPFDSFGPLRFEMTPSDVQAALREEPKPFAKGSSPDLVEAYVGAGVHAYYDAGEMLEFIEAFPPCRPVYSGVGLIREDAQMVVGDLIDLGLDVRDDRDGGLWVDDRGFALYAPTDRVEGVSAFRRGYDTGGLAP